MNPSVFEHLAKRFSECRKEINRDKVMSNGDVPSVLDTAGKALFEAIASGKIHLRDIPSWFTIEPDGIREDRDGNDRVYYSWDLFWLFAIKWLAKNTADSGITFSLYIPRENPEGWLHSGEDVEGLFHWLRLRGEHLKRAWHQSATVSEDACLYLAQISKGPSETEQNAAPAINIENIENFKGILGNVQSENVQTGNHASIHKQTVTAEKKRGILRKIPRWIYYILGTLAALVGILHHLGWLEPIRRLFSR